MFKWLSIFWSRKARRKLTAAFLSADLPNEMIKFHFPKGKDKYYCPGCSKLMEQGQLFELVVGHGMIEAYHRGCYNGNEGTSQVGPGA